MHDLYVTDTITNNGQHDMRLILSSDEGEVVALWAKMQERSITGCFFAADTVVGGMSGAGKSRVHFTYPADGDMHYSVATIHPDVEVFETHFRNRIRVKTIDRISGCRSDVVRAPNLIADAFSSWVQRSGQSLADIAAGSIFMFPTIGIPIEKGNMQGGLSRIGKPIAIAPRRDDVRIDLRQLRNGPLNISGCIYGRNIGPTRWEGTYVIGIENRGELYLEIHALLPSAA